MVFDKVPDGHEKETREEALYRGIAKYREHLKEHQEALEDLRREFESTRKDLVALREIRDAQPDSAVAKQRYAKAAEHFAVLQKALFEDEGNIRAMRQIPQLEQEIKVANAEFLRKLN